MNLKAKQLDTTSFLLGFMALICIASVVCGFYAGYKLNQYKNVNKQLLQANADMNLQLDNLDKIFKGQYEEYLQEINEVAKKSFEQQLQQQ